MSGYENTFDEGLSRPGKAELEAMIQRAEAAALETARRTTPGVTSFHFGAFDLDPQHLALWLVTATDRQRDALLADGQADAAVRQALADAGYPRRAIPLVGVTAESRETVDRDFGGDWWAAVK